MAKTARTLTEAEKNLKRAQDTLKKAKETLAKHDTEANKKAVATATEALKPIKKMVNRERFIRVGSLRVTKAVEALQAVGKMAQPNSYDFNDSDVSKIDALLDKHRAEAIAALKNAGKKTGTAEKGSVITFE